jgi:hypothetical protein
LGDLSKAEAYRYYEHIIQTNHPEQNRELFPSEVDFDKVFSVAGGRIQYLDQYVSAVALSGFHATGNIFWAMTHGNPLSSSSDA